VARSRKRPTTRSPSDHTPRSRPPCSPKPKPAHRPARWVDAPPSGGLSGVSSRPRAPMRRRRASAPSRFQRRALIHKRCASEILGPTTHQLAVVWVLPAWLADPPLVDPRPTVTCEVMQVSIDSYSFSSDRVTSFLLLLPQPRICVLAWL
jgi:hypothetical protein